MLVEDSGKFKISMELSLALLLEMNLIANILFYLGIGSGFISAIAALVALLAIVAICIEQRSILRSIRLSAFPLILLVLVIPSLTIFGEVSRITPLQYAVYVILPFLIIYRDINLRRLLDCLLGLSLFAVPFVGLLLDGFSAELSMSYSYGLMPSELAALILFRYFRGRMRAWEYIAILVNLFFIGLTVFFGSRGALVSFVVSVVLLYLGILPGQDLQSRPKRSIRVFILVIVFIVILMNLTTILNALASVLDGFGISIYAIQHTISVMSTELGISSGREELIARGLAGFMESPLIGNGFCSFNTYLGSQHILYPHNIFVQILHDGGMLLFCFVVIPIVVMCVRAFSKLGERQYAIFVLMFCLCVRFLFSSDIFESPWLWIALCLSVRHMMKGD